MRIATYSRTFSILKKYDKFAKKTGISKDEITYELNIDVDVKGNCLNMYVHEGDTREVYAVVCDNNYNIKNNTMISTI